MRSVPTGQWKTYRVVAKRVYSGELKDYLIKGFEFEFNGAKVRVGGQEIVAPHIRGLIRKGYAVEVTEAEEAEAARPQTKSLIDRSIEAKQKSIRVLPENWAQMHWKHKLQYISTSTDMETLKNIKRIESRAVKTAAEDRMETLEQEALEAQVTAPPAKVKKGPVASLDVEDAEDLAKALGAEMTLTGENGEALVSDEG